MILIVVTIFDLLSKLNCSAIMLKVVWPCAAGCQQAIGLKDSKAHCIVHAMYAWLT